MVIDTHYHFYPKPLGEAALAERAHHLARVYGAGSRNGVPVDEAQILEGLRNVFAPDPDGSRLLARMDDAGVERIVLVVVDRWGEYDEAALMDVNRACAERARRYPDHLIAFAGIDPRRKNAPDLLRRCIEDYGIRGMKWHQDLGFYPNSPEAYALLAVAQELKAPLLTHTGPLPSPPMYRANFTHPNLLDDVCLDFPELKVVAAHMGRNWWADWAGLAQFRPNLFGDLAPWQYAASRNYPRFCRILRDIIDWCGIEAVLFGTDAPFIEALVPTKSFVGMIRDLPSKAPPGVVFTEAEVEAILSGNARRVLGL